MLITNSLVERFRSVEHRRLPQGAILDDLPDPFSIPSMEKATARVLRGIPNRDRITIHGDYDCDGVLGTHILRSVITGLGATSRPYLPHRDEGYGLSSPTVHPLML